MKKLFLVSLFLFTGSLAVAQYNYFYAGWNYNVPLSNKEWLDSPTGYGGMAGYRFMVREAELSIGIDVNWATYQQYEPTTTFPRDNGAITTDYFKFVDTYGAVVSAQYYFHPGESEFVFPYVGLGVGANYNNYSLQYNIYLDEYDGFGFLARPEAGVVVRFSERKSIGAIAAVHYDYSTNRNSQYNYSSFSSAGFRIGIVFMNRY